MFYENKKSKKSIICAVHIWDLYKNWKPTVLTADVI